MREGKGKSIIEFPENYCIVDVETTGLDFEYCRIIELSALKIIGNKIVDSFSALVNPGTWNIYNDEIGDFAPTQILIPDFVTELTGITNDMVKDKPIIKDIIPVFSEFISDSILIGHNIVAFDSIFLYDDFYKSGKLLSNTLVDTMRLSRWILPDLDHHRLSDLAAYYHIDVFGTHRGLPDCNTTFEVYNQLKNTCIANFGNIGSFLSYVKSRLSKTYYALRSKDIKTDKKDFDVSNPLYHSVCVFTGTLEKMTRREAMQIVKDLGGECGDSVTKKTNYLVLGNNDFCKTIKGGKSNKQKKAEKLKLEGIDINVISESVFYEMAGIE